MSNLELSFPFIIDDLISALNQNHLCETIIFKNCQTSQNVINLMEDHTFQKKFFELNNALAIAFKIDDDLENITINDIDKLKISLNRDLVLGFFNEPLDRFKIFWKLKNTEFIWISFDNVEANLNLTDCDISKVFRFIVGTITSCIRKGILAINSQYSKNQKFYALKQMIDEENDNLLFSSVKSGDPKVISFFLHFHDVNEKTLKKSGDDESAIRIACRNENIEVFLMLLKNDSAFPDDFNNEDKERFKLKNNDFKNYIESIENLHEKVVTITEEDFEKLLKYAEDRKDSSLLSNEVKQFYCALFSHCKQSYCYDIHNISLAHQALKLNKINLFKFLKQYFGMSFGLYEVEAQKCCSYFTNLNIESCQKFSEHHLDVLISQTRVNISTQEPTKLQYETVRKVLNYLDTIDKTKPILKIIAAHSNFKLVFDTKRNDVTNMQVDSEQGTLGVIFWRSGNIIVGAKDLFEKTTMQKICVANFKFDGNLDVKIAQIIGTLKHEFCHYAMLLTFRNRCKPFSLGCDDEFKKILKECKEKVKISSNADEVRIIGSVFTEYDKNVWAAELIVRPAQIYAEFSRKPHIMLNFRLHFMKLFKFFDNKIMPKVENSLNAVESLTRADAEILYDELTVDLQTTLKNSFVVFQGYRQNISRLIHQKEEILRYLNTNQIKAILEDKNFLKIGEFIEEPEYYIHRSFIQKSTKANVNFEHMSSIAKAKKIFIIHEGVNEGKSKFLDFAANRLKTQNLNKWIVKIDRKVHGNIKQNQNFANFLTENVLKLHENSFEAKIFENMLEMGNVVLFWDHYEFKNIKEYVQIVLKDTKNEQWLAMWDYDEDCNFFGEEVVFEFLEMNENDKIKIVSKIERNEKEKFLKNH